MNHSRFFRLNNFLDRLLVRGLGLPIIFGIVDGTSSSIFIVPPILPHVSRRNPRGCGERRHAAGYNPNAIFGLWSTVLIAGVVAAAAGRLFIASSESEIAIFSQAVAGGAILALISHAMIPEAIDEGGSLVVLPTVGGFLFALFLALEEALV